MTDELPAGWKIAKMETLLTEPVRNGYSPVCPGQPTGRWILSLAAAQGGKFNASAIKPAPLNDSGLERFLLRPGDFLVSRSNTSDKVGLSCLYRGEIENCFYPDLLIRFRVDNTKVLDEYLEKFLASTSALAYLQGAAAGTSGSMKKITGKTLTNLPVRLPPLPEQRKIAEILSCWDQGIEKVERLISQEVKHKSSLLTVLMENSKCSRMPLGEFANLQGGYAFQSSKFSTSGIPIIRISNITSDEVKLDSNVVFYPSSESIPAQFVVTDGDILIAMSGATTGKVGRFGDSVRAYLNQRVGKFVILDNNRLNAEFLFQLVRTSLFRRQLNNQLVAGAQPNISSDSVENITVPVPSLREQKAISAVLAMADKKIATLYQICGQLMKQKQSLMQSLLTGKVRVNGSK